jgi:hypothetical protein
MEAIAIVERAEGRYSKLSPSERIMSFRNLPTSQFLTALIAVWVPGTTVVT